MPFPTRRSAGLPHRPRAGALIITAAAVLVAAATLTPTGAPSDAAASPWCLVCGPVGMTDAIANVLLFVPLGVGLALRGWRPGRALAAVALATFAIEVLQWRLVTGRDASLGDLLTNVAGGVLGYWGARGARGLAAPTSGAAAALAAAWTACWLGGAALTVWALAPAPLEQRWWVYLNATPSSRSAAGSRLSVIDARLGGIPLADGPVPEQTAVRDRVLAGSELAVRVERRAPAPPSANLVNVEADEADIDVLGLSKSAGSIQYRVRMRADRLRLRTPVVGVREGKTTAPTDTVRYVGALDRQRLAVAVEDRGGRRERVLALGPNLGWLLLSPVDYVVGGSARALTALWVIALAFPVGYWAGRALLGRRAHWNAAWAVLAAPGPALALLAHGYSSAPMHWSEWAAWLVGTAAGVAVARAVRGSPVVSSARTTAADAATVRSA